MRWRADSASAAKDAADPKTTPNQQTRSLEESLLRPQLFKQPYVKPIHAGTPPLKEQFVVPPKLSLNGLLSPCKQMEKYPYQVSGGDVKLPMLPALSFPLLSQEETAEVQPLSPLSGSDSSAHELTKEDCFPNFMTW